MTQESARKKPGKNLIQRLFSLSYSGLIIITLVLVILLSVVTPNNAFLQPNNLLNVLRQVSVYGIMAVGMAFVMISGGIDLSVGSVAGFSGCVTSLLVTNEVMSLMPSMLVGVVSGLLSGVICGLIIAYTGIPPFITTLSVQISVRGLAYIVANGKPIGNLPKNLLNLGVGSVFGVPIPIIFMVLFLLMGALILNRTTFGRTVYAVGGNRTAAHLAGVNVKKVTILVYTISGVVSAFAGIVLAARNVSAQPNAGVAFETEAIAGCAIGGVAFDVGSGSMSGVARGIIRVGIINNGMNLLGISSYWQLVVKGLIMVTAVIYSMRNSKRNA